MQGKWTAIGGVGRTGKGYGVLQWYLTEKQARAVIKAYDIPVTHSYGSKTYYDTDRIHIVHEAQWNEWVVCVANGDRLGQVQVEWAVT